MRRLAAVLLLALPAAAGDYVVLSGVDEKDPYYPAATAIARFHKGADIVRFDPEHPETVLARLRELKATQVAIVVRPEQIDINSVRRFLKTAAQVDEDPLVDFDFGYITGATAEEAVRFVENIVRASKQERPRRVGQAKVQGGKSPCSASDGEYAAGSLKFPSRVLVFNPPDGEQGRDQKFIDGNLASLAGCGAIMMGGHGMPWEIGSGPRAEDIAKVNLFPAVVYNYACHTGVALRWHDWKYDKGEYVDHLATIGAEKSFALSVIHAGATGYVAYVNPRPAGPELSIDFEKMLAGATLGESRRQDYAKVVLGYLGFHEKAIAAGDVEEGHRKAAKDVDPVRDMMLDDATGGILYGDPAMRPFAPAANVLPQTVEAKREGAAIHVTFRVAAMGAGVWCWDPFVKGEKTMAMKVCDRIELPAGFKVESVTVDGATRGKDTLTTRPVLFAEETDGGKRFLHVKVNFTYDEKQFGDIEVRVTVKGK